MTLGGARIAEKRFDANSVMDWELEALGLGASEKVGPRRAVFRGERALSVKGARLARVPFLGCRD